MTRGSDPHESKYRVRTHGHPSHGGVYRADAGSENCPHLGWSQPQSARVAALLMTAKASAVSNILEGPCSLCICGWLLSSDWVELHVLWKLLFVQLLNMQQIYAAYLCTSPELHNSCLWKPYC